MRKAFVAIALVGLASCADSESDALSAPGPGLQEWTIANSRRHPGNLVPELDFASAPYRFLSHPAIWRNDTLYVRVLSGDTAAVILAIAMVTLGPRVAEAVADGGSAEAPREVGK